MAQSAFLVSLGFLFLILRCALFSLLWTQKAALDAFPPSGCLLWVMGQRPGREAARSPQHDVELLLTDGPRMVRVDEVEEVPEVHIGHGWG